MDILLSDNVKMRLQQSNGSYKRISARSKKINSQEEFFKQARASLRDNITAPDVMFRPKTKP